MKVEVFQVVFRVLEIEVFPGLVTFQHRAVTRLRPALSTGGLDKVLLTETLRQCQFLFITVVALLDEPRCVWTILELRIAINLDPDFDVLA